MNHKETECENTDWTGLSQNWVQRWDFVSSLMNFKFHKLGNFLTS
jgi:hypothetical protein